MQERGSELKNLNRIDIYPLYKNEYRYLKLTETTVKKGLR
jgi:hypothetical protein